MTNIQQFQTLDDQLLASSKDVKTLLYITPINAKEQKEEFLAGRTQSPKFVYRDLTYDPREVEQKLRAIDVPEGVLKEIFEINKEHLLLENKIIINRGDQDFIREATITIHGSPTKQLVQYAEQLLGQTPNIVSEKNVFSQEIKKALEETLEELELTDWKVEFSEKRLTTIYSADKKITVCKDRKFAAIDPTRLAIHEVGVHLLRSANGYEQPLKMICS